MSLLSGGRQGGVSDQWAEWGRPPIFFGFFRIGSLISSYVPIEALPWAASRGKSRHGKN